MILYYSNPEAPKQPQPNPGKSLGGWPSLSIIPNGSVGNIFPGIAQTDIENKVVEVRMIVLKNQFSDTKNNIKIYTITPNDAYTTIKLGLADPTFNAACDANYFEYIVSPHSLPYYADIQPHEGLVNAATKASLAANGELGIWLLREINSDKIPDIKNKDLSCEALATNLEELGDNIQLEDNIQLLITWN